MTPEPITTHNRALLDRVMRETRTFSRYPRVSEQVECLPLETHKLFAGAYNPSINANGLMVYRFHRTKLATKLAAAQLGDNGAVLSNRELETTGKTVDDPKLFTHCGIDYMSWVEADWDDKDYSHTIRCVVKFGVFDGAKVEKIQQPAFRGNDWSGMCKNLVFFSHSDRLFCVFSCHPDHLVYEWNPTFTKFSTPGPTWAYGEIRGGTAPLPYEGKLLRFFHSRLDNEWFGARHRYYVGAMLLNPESPFEVVRVSRKPIIYASEIGAASKKDFPSFKPNVVFPGGAIERDGGWTLALGINDCECALAKITPGQLNF